MRHFDAKKLAELMATELAGRNVDPESIRNVVASLIQTSLRGVDSHGINIFPHYCRAVAAGRVNARPLISVNRTGSATAVVMPTTPLGITPGPLPWKRLWHWHWRAAWVLSACAIPPILALLPILP